MLNGEQLLFAQLPAAIETSQCWTPLTTSGCCCNSAGPMDTFYSQMLLRLKQSDSIVRLVGARSTSTGSYCTSFGWHRLHMASFCELQ